MRIINKTNWRSRDLKKLFSVALNEDDKVEGKYKYRDRLSVQVVYSRGLSKWAIETFRKYGKEAPKRLRYSGCAFLNGNLMRLRIPKEEINSERLARIFIHEMSHIRGFYHRSMGRCEDVKVEWASKYQIREREIRVKQKVDMQVKRYKHVLSILKDKQSSLKRLQSAIKRWNQKRKYYEKILVANGKIREK